MDNQEIEVFENDIRLYLSIFMETEGIDDIRSASQQNWNAALMFIKKHVFNDKSILKSKNNIITDKAIMSSTFNAYDYDIVDDICNIYIYLCMLYDKEISMVGFSNLTGINTETMLHWGNGEIKSSNKSIGIYKKLNSQREESLSNIALTGKRNPVGPLAVLNHEFAWNTPEVNKAVAQRVLSSSELPQLSDNSKQFMIDVEDLEDHED